MASPLLRSLSVFALSLALGGLAEAQASRPASPAAPPEYKTEAGSPAWRSWPSSAQPRA